MWSQSFPPEWSIIALLSIQWVASAPNQFTNSFNPPPKDGQPFLLTWDNSIGGDVIIVDNWFASSGVGSNSAFARTVYSGPSTGSYLWNVPSTDVHGPHYLTIGTDFGVIDEASPFWTVADSDVSTPAAPTLFTSYTDTLASVAAQTTSSGQKRPPIVYNPSFYSNSYGQDLQCTGSITSAISVISAVGGYPSSEVVAVSCVPSATSTTVVKDGLAQRQGVAAAAPTITPAPACPTSGYMTHPIGSLTVCCPSYWSVYRFSLFPTIYCASGPSNTFESSSYNPTKSAVDLYFVTITPAGIYNLAAVSTSSVGPATTSSSSITTATTTRALGGVANSGSPAVVSKPPPPSSSSSSSSTSATRSTASSRMTSNAVATIISSGRTSGASVAVAGPSQPISPSMTVQQAAALTSSSTVTAPASTVIKTSASHQNALLRYSTLALVLFFSLFCIL